MYYRAALNEMGTAHCFMNGSTSDRELDSYPLASVKLQSLASSEALSH